MYAIDTRKSLCLLILTISLVQYISNRQFWLDESMLAVNVRELSWQELFSPLKMEQSAPIGFLLFSKLSISLFGTSELAFRLPALLIFLASLWMVHKRKDLFSDASIALIFLNSFLIYYSSEFKQYIVDFYVGTVMLALVKDSSYRQAIVFLTVSIWFSNVTVVLLPALIMMYILFEHKKKTTDLVRLGTLAGSAVLFYFGFVKDHPTRGYMLAFHSGNMGILGDNSLFSFMEHQIGALLTYTPFHFYLQTLRLLSLSANLSLLMVSVIILALVNIARRTDAYFLLYLGLAFASHYAFAVLNLYPAGLRFSLDLMPVLAAAFTMILKHLLPVINKSMSIKGFLILTGLLPVLFFDIRTTIFPIQYYEKANVRAMATYLEEADHRKVYVFKADIPQYLFYNPQLGFEKIHNVSLTENGDLSHGPVVCYEDDWRASNFSHIRPDTIVRGVRNLVLLGARSSRR